MSRRMKHRLAAALAFAFVGATQAEPGITPTTIVIGQAAGFTGGVAGTVKELTAGAQLWFDAVNAKGGVHGRKIVLESADDGFDPKRTPDAMKKLIDEKNVFAMFLARGTPTTEAGYPVLEAARVPLIGPSTGAMSMYNPPRKYLFPVRASYHSETFKIVPQLVNMGINRIAILHVDDSFGKDGLAGVQQALKSANLAPLAVISHPRGSPPKVEEAVAAIAKVDPQAVIMVTVADAGVAFVKQMKKTGRNPMFITLSNNSSNTFIQNLGEDGWGVAVSQVSPYPFSGAVPITKEFLELCKAKNVAPSYSGIEGFIAAKVLVEGLRRAGKQPTRDKLIAGLESMQQVDLGGVDVSYGPELRAGTSYIDITIIGKNGKFVR